MALGRICMHLAVEAHQLSRDLVVSELFVRVAIGIVIVDLSNGVIVLKVVGELGRLLARRLGWVNACAMCFPSELLLTTLAQPLLPSLTGWS